MPIIDEDQGGLVVADSYYSTNAMPLYTLVLLSRSIILFFSLDMPHYPITIANQSFHLSQRMISSISLVPNFLKQIWSSFSSLKTNNCIDYPAYKRGTEPGPADASAGLLQSVQL